VLVGVVLVEQLHAIGGRLDGVFVAHSEPSA
jgi:hypothetical protein